MTNSSAQAQALFARYLEHWNARDIQAIAACFTEPSMFVLPTGTIAMPDRRALTTLLKKIFDGLDAAGFSHSEVGSVTATPCGDGLAIIDASRVRRLKADGSFLEEIDGHYVVRETDEGWRFTVAVVCVPGWRETSRPSDS
ncbi:MAG: nuclear transport factor 2 family protein [Geminicoccaceae bacterium]